MKQQQCFVLCYNYDDIAYPVVFTELDEARKKQAEIEKNEQRRIVVRVITIK